MNNATIYEVLKFAIGLEEEGELFYRHHAASYAGEVRTIFLKLANDEVEHANFFHGLYSQLEQNEENEYLFDQDISAYFKDLARETAFNRDVKASSLIEAIEEGLKTEKSTVVFYENLAKYASGPTLDMLLRLRDEEKKHVMILQDLLDQNI